MKFTLALGILCFSLNTNSQSIVGLWTVDQVTVGDEIMTPVAKWFNYKDDNTYTAGNGWLQNDEGTWNLDLKKNEFLPISGNGADEFGAFASAIQQNNMTWKRMEEGMQVVVSLSRITKIPKSPKDNIVGNWNLTAAKKGDEDIIDSYAPEGENIFIRWTGTYRKSKTGEPRVNGYWNMHAHRPELHLINYDRNKEVEMYMVSFEENTLVLKSKEDVPTIYTYEKNQF